MSWTNENIEKLKQTWKDRNKREQCFTVAPKCPACGTPQIVNEMVLKGEPKEATFHQVDGATGILSCQNCEEELLVVIHIPAPTYSTYVTAALQEDDEG